jgi:hypothetical protein
MTPPRDRLIRSQGGGGKSDLVVFDYQGHATEVSGEHLVPESIGRTAVIRWFSKRELHPDIHWAVVDWPPNRQQTPGAS